jgi:hypothetical protein
VVGLVCIRRKAMQDADGSLGSSRVHRRPVDGCSAAYPPRRSCSAAHAAVRLRESPQQCPAHSHLRRFRRPACRRRHNSRTRAAPAWRGTPARTAACARATARAGRGEAAAPAERAPGGRRGTRRWRWRPTLQCETLQPRPLRRPADVRPHIQIFASPPPGGRRPVRPKV